jgi:hypothetical protein
MIENDMIENDRVEKPWVYCGAFLDRGTEGEKLYRFVEDRVGIPDGWRKYCDHLTIIYNDGSENAKLWYGYCRERFGNQVVLTVTGIGISENAIAVTVTGFPSNNTIPHITVSVSPTGKPVMSNYIKEWREVPAGERITLRATIDVFLKKH